MNQQLTQSFSQLKEYYLKQSKKTKTTMTIIMIMVVLLSMITPFLLRSAADREFAILYQGLSVSEQAEILSVLYDLRKDVRVSDDGTIRVKAEEVNLLKLQLSSMGYPRSSLSYNVFTSNSGFMTTELEKKQYLIIDLQSRLEETLRLINGVRRAVVTLNIPDDSNYIWQTSANQSTASVLLDLDASQQLENAQVQGIRNLVASAVPMMEAASVVVVDSNTGIEISAQNPTNNLDGNFLQLEFESAVEQRIEEKILNLLSMPYGLNNVRVSASVTIDYDKIISEELEFIPTENGRGVLESLEEWYVRDGNSINDPAGEESNTDIPVYVEGENGENVIERTISAQYLVSQIRRQIERNTAELESASVSVVINHEDISESDLENWTNVISRAVDINSEDIKVFNIYRDQGTIAPVDPGFNLFDNMQLIFIVGGVVTLLLVGAVIILITKSRKNKRENNSFSSRNPQDRLLTQPTMAQVDPVKATLTKLQDFTKENPEIAANLLRDMLKEDE